jgi:hypothetical protein
LLRRSGQIFLVHELRALSGLSSVSAQGTSQNSAAINITMSKPRSTHRSIPYTQLIDYSIKSLSHFRHIIYSTIPRTLQWCVFAGCPILAKLGWASSSPEGPLYSFSTRRAASRRRQRNF